MAKEWALMRTIFGKDRNLYQEIFVILGAVAMLILFFWSSPWQGRLLIGGDAGVPVALHLRLWQSFAPGEQVRLIDGKPLIATGRDWQSLLFEWASVILLGCILCWLLKTGKAKLFKCLAGKPKAKMGLTIDSINTVNVKDRKATITMRINSKQHEANLTWKESEISN